MSSDHTISDLDISWSPNDDDGEVDSRTRDVDRRVTVEDPSTPVSINARGMLEQGAMYTVASAIEQPEYVNIPEPSTSGRPIGILKDSPASLITEEMLPGIRTMYGIPRDVELRAPREYERADWDIPGWTCLYEYTFRLGFRFLIPQLVRRMLVYYELAPGQLMPNTWRILLGLGILCERNGVQFGLGCLLHNYYLKEHLTDTGRYSLVSRNKKRDLIIDTKTNDRNWKDTFFFTKGPPVDGPWRMGGEEYRYRRVWNRYEVGGAGKAPACDVAAERTRILLEIPAAHRSVSNLLTEDNFRPSRLWRWSTLNRSRAPYPHVKDFLSYIWIRRSFEILQYNLHFLKPLTDVERRFAVTTMASAEINIPDNAETLRRYKEEFARKRAAAQKKRQAAEKSAGGSPSVIEPLLESSPERSSLKKKPRRAPAVERQKKAASSSKDKSTGSDLEPDSPMKLLASGLSSFKDPAGFLKRSDDFTLVDDDMHLKRVKTEEVFDTLLLSNFQAYQATLHLHGRYKAINDKSVALRKAGDALKAENAKLSTDRSLIEQQRVALEEELKNERARHQAEVAKLNEAAGQQDKTIEALRERALSIAVEAVCKTRAELFKEYLSGDHLKWNPQTMQEEIDMYEEMQRLKLEESQGAGVDEDVQNVDENLGDDTSLDKGEAAATDGPPQAGL
ncbi:hypothetical protein LWI29_028019 [Acer saccharum]|uniref:Uncharacterized protein n=1 Tax=Acer saccharum TaxID=4024 RepID=A0AA39SLZ4_ACESA|nr:hypothetical protein LWI29_028019 [Acer saccharum]